MELQFLFSALCQILVYICTHILGGIFIAKNSLGHNSVKNEGGVTVLFLCTLSDDGLYFYKVSWTYSLFYDNYRADTIFIGSISKRHNSVKEM